MSLKNQQAYQPLPSAVAAMDNPAMSNSSSSSGSNDDVADLVQSRLPPTYSSQQLVSSDSDSMERQHLRGSNIVPGVPATSHKQWFAVAVLCFVNLINYMDRFTIAGVLTDVKKTFAIDNDSAGLLQTVFVLSYMVFAPLFGYMGDRYSRRWLMVVGVALWSTTTLFGSFMKTFGGFITFRALVGIGEASYSTIAPTIISDLFVDSMRSKMLALFYFAIPVGSGLGYIVGSKTAELAQDWRWALRVTPALGITAVVLLSLLKDPKRGESEGVEQVERASFCVELKDLLKNRSFMLSTAGFTCVAFVTGALAWWGPNYIHLGLKMQPGNENLKQEDVSYMFGLITMVAGLVGVPLGSVLSTALKKRNKAADPLICAGGLLLSAPLLTGACLVISKHTVAAYVLMFFGQVAINLNWAIVADILLYVVVPMRRSTAEAVQILASHALGDAGSPYLVGAISTAIKNKMLAQSRTVDSDVIKSMSQLAENATEIVTDTLRLRSAEDVYTFESLQYSLFSTTFVEVLGGVFFLITACYIIKDKARATAAVRADNDLRLAPDNELSLVPNPTYSKTLFDAEYLANYTDIALRERA
ncbi:protein spinster isoform X2 [Drosophila navojoa]|uniref:protein spinster isoform X2 n=1 Tax=Drosophila navojoa TaxID=7232 RepID=UPI0008464A4C|nr:protein spinster isoform X2 [Drosophila navojoa]